MTTLRLAAIATLLTVASMPVTLAHDTGVFDPRDFATELHAVRQIGEGRHSFRYATFGDEAFWGDTLQLHRNLLAG